MSTHAVIGGGLSGRFLAYLLEAKNKPVTIYHKEKVADVKPLKGEAYSGPYGGLENWGGHLFIDYRHQVFSNINRAKIISLLANFIAGQSFRYETYENKYGFGFLLPKNWKPISVAECREEKVTNIDTDLNTVTTVSGNSTNHRTISICTGSQVIFKADGNCLAFQDVSISDIYDKLLMFKDIDTLENNDSFPKVIEDEYFFTHLYPLAANIDFENNSESLVRLMHYTNKVISARDLQLGDIINGLKILVSRVVMPKAIRGYILTKSPIEGKGYRFSEVIKSGKGVALHFNIYQDRQILNLLKVKMVISDAHKEGGVSLACGNVGYRVLNVLKDYYDYTEASSFGCEL